MLADLPDIIVFENVIGFDVGLLYEMLGAHYSMQAVEMRPEDCGFSFILQATPCRLSQASKRCQPSSAAAWR